MAVLVVGAAIAAAVAFVRWSGAREPIVVAAGDLAPAHGDGRVATPLATLQPAASGEATTPTAPGDSGRSEVAAPSTGLSGSVRFANGEPLAHWTIVLRPLERRPVPLPGVAPPAERPRGVGTDARGAFEFVGVEPGEYEVWPEGVPDAARKVVVTRGERCHVEIVLDSVLFSGRFLHGGRPARGVSLQLHSLDRPAEVHAPGYDRRRLSLDTKDVTPFLDGASFRMTVPPGRYRALLADGLWPQLPAHEVPIDIPVGVAAIERDFEVPGTQVTVDVHDETGAPLRRCAVCFDGEIEGGKRALRVFEGANGQIVVERVPPGTWQVGVGSPDAQETPSRSFTTSAAVGRDRIEFVVPRGCEVRLTTRLPNGSVRRFDVELMPVLRAGDRTFACQLFRDPEARTPPMGYRNVPPGRATLLTSDRLDSEPIVFLPFETSAPRDVELVFGVANEIVLDVLPRAFVDLRACEESGREQPSARLVLLHEGRRVHPATDAQPNGWRGWLPPGDYRVRIDRAGVSGEHDLRVDRRDLAIRYRP